MNTTQNHLPIADIQEGIVILKGGGGALILQVSAVNFGLLSGREQMAIIDAFAQMLNSLSFSIQIVIDSERLDISSYLELLNKAQKSQTNQLLSQMMSHYRQFIQSTIKENEVLDKKFYIVVPLFKLELGLIASKQALEQKIKTVLLPRRDQILRQLSRIGLKATQLDNQKLLQVFFNIYNYSTKPSPALPTMPVNLKEPKSTPKPLETVTPAQVSQIAAETKLDQAPIRSQSSRAHPFVVEELEG